MLNLILLQNYPTRQSFCYYPETGKQNQYPCTLNELNIILAKIYEIIFDQYGL